MANSLLIEKQTGGYFKFTLNGDTANAVTSIQNDLLAVGNQLHFKTGNGANIIKEQFIYPEDVTIVSGGTFTFTTVAQVWDKLIDIDYFAWLGGGGGSGVYIDRFDNLVDTFKYTGNAGKTVVVDNSELKLVPVTLYNKRLFTELDDTPDSLVPNKMVVVNSAGNALILQDQPEAPESLLNSVGYFDYNDLITQTTPLTAVTNTPLKLTNDSEGANTSTDQNPYGVSYVWDSTTNQFNFSELSVGDTIDVRVHVQVTTTTSNQKVDIKAKFGIGSVAEFTNSIFETTFKSSGLHEISFVAPFYMGSTYITDYPAELYLTTDASATVQVDGWYIRIIRKDINIITVDYAVPDATTLVKGIVRLGGDLAGTANSPTVPELANKVPTSRTIGTTSPLLGGGALTSDLVLSIQQANSTQSGYLSSTDWNTFYNKANDNAVVHLTGTETITGLKTFSADLNISDLYINGYSGTSGRLSLKQATSAGFSGIGYTTINALGTSSLSLNFRQSDGSNKTMQIDANLISGALRVFQFPNNDGVIALTSDIHNAVTIGTANGLSLSTQVLSLGLASSSANGALSSTDWTTFNNKQNALTNPVTASTFTANYLSKFTGSGYAIGNSIVWDNGTNVGIGTTAPDNATNYSTLSINGVNGGQFTFQTSGTKKGYIYNTSSSLIIGADTANNLIFDAGALERMRITSGGNVGIGTTSPSTICHLYKASFPILTIQSSSYQSSLGIDTTSGNLVLNNESNAPLSFNTNATERMRITSGGNVGIGTTSPNSNSNRTTLTLNNNTWGGQLDINVGGTNHAQFGTDNFNSGLSCRIQSQDGIVFNAGGANERMRITSSGNVGIGTTSPLTALTVSGNLSLFTTNQIRLYNSAKNNWTQVDSPLLSGDTEVDFRVLTKTGTFYINASGNVGIGTTSPAQKLHIGGVGSAIAFDTTGATGTSIIQTVEDYKLSLKSNRGGTTEIKIGDSNLEFLTNSSERMRITSAGEVLINMTSTSTSTSGTMLSQGTAFANLRLFGTGSHTFSQFFLSGVAIGSITGSGSITSYNITSDYRLKQDFKPFNGLDLVSKIKVYDYEWKVDNSRMNGVIAHELQEVVPYAVTGEKDGESMQQVDYSKLVPILVQAIKELKTEIETLKK